MLCSREAPTTNIKGLPAGSRGSAQRASGLSALFSWIGGQAEPVASKSVGVIVCHLVKSAHQEWVSQLLQTSCQSAINMVHLKKPNIKLLFFVHYLSMFNESL